MKVEKGNSTKFQVTGCEAQASTSEAEVIAQQAFDSWVLAMESAAEVVEALSLRDIARVKIEESRSARARAEGRE